VSDKSEGVPLSGSTSVCETEATWQELRRLRDLVFAWLTVRGASRELSDSAMTAAFEAMENIRCHAYPDEGLGPMRVTITADHHVVSVTVRDWGVGMGGGTGHPDPLGVGLMLKMCPTVEISTTSDGHGSAGVALGVRSAVRRKQTQQPSRPTRGLNGGLSSSESGNG